MPIDKRELWVQWTRDAQSKYVADGFESSDELVDDMAEVATKFADEMLDQFEERFENEEPARPARRARKSPKTRRESED